MWVKTIQIYILNDTVEAITPLFLKKNHAGI
jgi:hypothetical protein